MSHYVRLLGDGEYNVSVSLLSWQFHMLELLSLVVLEKIWGKCMLH
jgi:hypothetical protein